MEMLLEYLRRYDIWNNLFPGMIFIYSYNIFWKVYDWNQIPIVYIFFLAYFVGMIISRIGSICIEPLLKKIKFIIFIDYKFYLTAIECDNDIIELNTVNNVYRTILTGLIIFLLVFIKKEINNMCMFISSETVICNLFLILLFLFSYRKQTGYINKRVSKYI